MGVHQYQLEVIPKSFVGDPPIEAVSLAQVQEGLDPWMGQPNPDDAFLEGFRNLLPLNKSWGSVEEYVSGQDFGSKARIWWEEGVLESIEFCYSPATDPWSLLEQFANLAKSAGFLLLERETGRVVQPSSEALKECLTHSRAWRFLSEPVKTILEASNAQQSRQKDA